MKRFTLGWSGGALSKKGVGDGNLVMLAAKFDETKPLARRGCWCCCCAGWCWAIACDVISGWIRGGCCWQWLMTNWRKSVIDSIDCVATRSSNCPSDILCHLEEGIISLWMKHFPRLTSSSLLGWCCLGLRLHCRRFVCNYRTDCDDRWWRRESS